MSAQAVRDFWQKAQTDPGLRQQLQELKTDEQAAAITGAVKLAAAAGFAFTAQDYETALKERRSEGNLSDVDLARVTGGALADDVSDIVVGAGPGAPGGHVKARG